MIMERYNKIGFKYVGAGVIGYTVVLVIVGIVGLCETLIAGGAVTGTMAAAIMLACKESYVAGRKDSCRTSQ